MLTPVEASLEMLRSVAGMTTVAFSAFKIEVISSCSVRHFRAIISPLRTADKGFEVLDGALVSGPVPFLLILQLSQRCRSQLIPECAPMKRTRSASRERIDDFVIRCRIGPTITQTTITPEHPPFMKRSRPADIEELPPVVVTRVRPNVCLFVLLEFQRRSSSY